MDTLNTLQADVLIIGAGAAGCRAAIEAAERGARVLLLSKGRFTHSGSSFYPLTQGLGFTTAVPGDTDEAGGSTELTEGGIEAHYAEIMAAGQGMTSPTLARALAEDAPRRVGELIGRFGLEFDHGPDGSILHIKPDYGSGAVRAGGASIEALRSMFEREVRRRGVQVYEHATAIRLLGDGFDTLSLRGFDTLSLRGGCCGCVAVTDAGELLLVDAGATVLAAGGYAGLFEHHLTTAGQLGEGYALALNLGAELVNLEYYQMILGLTAPRRGMLIAESTLESLPRLSNAAGESFLERYLPAGVSAGECMRERAHTGPFHVGTRAMYFDVALFGEMRAGRALPSGGLECDFSGVEPADLRGFRADWLEWALRRGLDVRQTPVEIAPQVHADNGGVLIDAHGATGVSGLFACGEVAGGAHGANRIGGNMMTNTQVFGARAGAAAAEYAAGAARPALGADAARPELARLAELGRRAGTVQPCDALARLRRAMYYEMAVQKDAASLTRLLETLDEIQKDELPALALPAGEAGLALGLPLALETARLVARSALLRRESRGPHYRADFPQRDDAGFGRPIVWRKGEGGESLPRFEGI